MIILAEITIQGAAYLSALAWLAWRFERLKGIDAFHMVAAFVMGVLFADALATAGVGPLTAVALGSATAWCIDVVWLRLSRGGTATANIVVMIATASLALLLFDWVTAYVPVALPGAREQLTVLAVIVWLCGAVLITGIAPTQRGRNLRLGRLNQWAPAYWGGVPGYPSVSMGIMSFGAWFCVLALPASTTGLLSSTLLKDVAMAILISRVAGARGAFIILAMALSVAALKVMAGYLVTAPLALPMVDATVFVALFLWLRYRGSRTAWTSDGNR